MLWHVGPSRLYRVRTSQSFAKFSNMVISSRRSWQEKCAISELFFNFAVRHTKLTFSQDEPTFSFILNREDEPADHNTYRLALGWRDALVAFLCILSRASLWWNLSACGSSQCVPSASLGGSGTKSSAIAGWRRENSQHKVRQDVLCVGVAVRPDSWTFGHADWWSIRRQEPPIRDKS